VSAVRRQYVSRSALAIKRADGVPAPAVPAQERHGPALVHVFAVRGKEKRKSNDDRSSRTSDTSGYDTYAIVVLAQFEPVEADARERPDGIDARAVVAHVRLTAALVHVHARVPGRRPRVPVAAVALETAVQVGAPAVPADAVPLVALVHV